MVAKRERIHILHCPLEDIWGNRCCVLKSASRGNPCHGINLIIGHRQEKARFRSLRYSDSKQHVQLQRLARKLTPCLCLASTADHYF